MLATDEPVGLSHLKVIEQPKKFELFEFQKGMIAQTYQHIREGKRRICLIAPCGGGKTAIASTILKDATKASTPVKCVFLVDLNCLLDQTAKVLRGFGIPCSVFQGSRKTDWSADVIVASVQTVTARLKKQSLVDMFGTSRLFIFDECHISSFHRSSIELENEYLPRGAIFLGLTGSPWRLNKSQCLADRFDVAVEAPQPPELVKLGRIVPARCYSIDGVIDISKLDTRGGDFVESQMEEQAIGQASLDCVVNEWRRLGGGRPTAAYCSGVKHAQRLAETFVEAGIPAEWQCGSTKMGKNGKEEHLAGEVTRKAQDYRLANGITKILCSVGTLTAGWDVPIVSCILMVRATQSKALYLQATNRGSRVHEASGKVNFIVLDFGRNVQRFGSPTGYQDYSITLKKREKASKVDPYKACPACNSVVARTARVCPHCGYEFNPDLEPEPELDFEVQLVEWFDDHTKQQVRFLRDAKRLAFKLGDDPNNPIQQFIRIYGFPPPKEWHQGAILGDKPSKRKRKEFEDYLIKTAGSWFEYHRDLEYGLKANPLIAEKSKWWQVLGVSKSATREECKLAYRNLALQYHPDVCGEQDSTNKMQILNRAWEEAQKEVS